MSPAKNLVLVVLLVAVLLIPIMIFRYPIPVYWWTYDDLNRATLAEARERGIL